MPHPLRQIQEHPTDPDELSIAQGTDLATWGLPSDEGLVGQHPGVVPAPTQLDYAEGILVGYGVEEDAQPVDPAAHLIRARVDAPPSYQMPHEAMHRRYEPPRILPIAQTVIGTLMFAPTTIGLHMVKVIALVVSLAANGTIQFVEGSNDGTVVAPIGFNQAAQGVVGGGAMNLLAGSPLVLPPAELANPWLWTAPDQALGLITTGAGAFANGFAIVAYSPYDQ